MILQMDWSAKMKKVSSHENPTFRQLRLLAHSARERRKQGKTILDGIHLVSGGIAQSGPPELLVVSESGLRHHEIENCLSVCPRHSSLLLSDALFNEASPVETPSGILAVIPIPKPPKRPADAGSCVLLSAIQDSGNLGAILRTAAAAGLADVFLGTGCAQAWSPRVLRAAMGAHFQLRIHEQARLDQVMAEFQGISMATHLQAPQSLYEMDLRGNVAWIFGNEGNGLDEQIVSASHHCVRIPMPGRVESLNVAAAAAICLFEEVRQKSIRIHGDRA